MHHIYESGSSRTHIQILQTVPAEGVFAALAQHLCTALVPLNVDTTHRTLFDGHIRVTVGAGPVDGEKDTGDIRYAVNGGTLEYVATRASGVSRHGVKSLFSSRVKGHYSL